MNSFKNVALGNMNTRKSNSMLGYNIPVVAPAVNAVANVANNAVKVANNAFNAAALNVGNAANSFLNSTKNAANSVLNIGTATATAGVAAGIPWLWIGVGIIFITLIVLATVYYNNIKDVLANVGPTPAPSDAPSQKDFETPPPPGVDQSVPAAVESIVDKVLPGKKEVFSVQSNRFRYQDAKPLCKALGAELATYDQVKESWDKGADWCNYGWSKGQMALYPTQKETWEKLQNGPEGQRLACGRPGVNGGYFDNPDLRFGVNCYGAKPDQDDHDLSQIDAQPPLTPAMIDFDKKVADFRSEADHIGVLPFKGGKWSE
jgi:hypothetical protein